MRPIRFWKRVLALTLCVGMLAGNVMTTNATGVETNGIESTQILSTENTTPVDEKTAGGVVDNNLGGTTPTGGSEVTGGTGEVPAEVTETGDKTETENEEVTETGDKTETGNLEGTGTGDKTGTGNLEEIEEENVPMIAAMSLNGAAPSTYASAQISISNDYVSIVSENNLDIKSVGGLGNNDRPLQIRVYYNDGSGTTTVSGPYPSETQYYVAGRNSASQYFGIVAKEGYKVDRVERTKGKTQEPYANLTSDEFRSDDTKVGENRYWVSLGKCDGSNARDKHYNYMDVYVSYNPTTTASVYKDGTLDTDTIDFATSFASTSGTEVSTLSSKYEDMTLASVIVGENTNVYAIKKNDTTGYSYKTTAEGAWTEIGTQAVKFNYVTNVYHDTLDNYGSFDLNYNVTELTAVEKVAKTVANDEYYLQVEVYVNSSLEKSYPADQFYKLAKQGDVFGKTVDFTLTTGTDYTFAEMEFVDVYGLEKSSETNTIQFAVKPTTDSLTVNTLKIYLEAEYTTSATKVLVGYNGYETRYDSVNLVNILDSTGTRVTPHNATFAEAVGKIDTQSQWTTEFSYVKVGDTAVQYMKKDSNDSLFYSNDNKNWTAVGKNEIKIVYVYAKTGTKIDTVDTRGLVSINLFNYNLTNINNGNTLQFSTSPAAATSSTDYNKWVNSGTEVLAGILKNKLGEDGYPALNVGSKESLKYLWDPTATTGIDQKNIDASYLFSYDEATQRYSFDSLTANAVINENTNDFDVYSITDGKFYPYGTATNADKYTLGMNIGFDFFQPASGMINSTEMTFEFSGDDDVWVFIDNVLVLDLGGIHGNIPGSINFATGVVTGANAFGTSNSTSTTLRDAFKAAGYTEEQLDKKFDENGRFIDYSDHRLEFYYLERGGNVSNCKISFNMPPIQQDTIMVTKKVSTLQSGAAVQDNVDYTFELYTGTTEDNLQKVTTGTYDLLVEGNVETAGLTVDADGRFTLRNGQSAVFKNIPAGTYYYVREVNPGTGYSVYANGAELTLADDYYTSTAVKASDVGAMLFTNRYDVITAEVKQTKTATVKDWDDRTYTINLGAYHEVELTEAVDVVMVLDISGSMPWLLNEPTTTIAYSELVQDSTENDQWTNSSWWDYRYYVAVKDDKTGATEYRPITYHDGKWVRVESGSDGTKIQKDVIGERDTIYVRDKGQLTKLDALKESVATFVDKLGKTSPDSRVAIVTFAGDVKASTQLVLASEPQDVQTVLNGIALFGGTDQSTGLKRAYEILGADTDQSNNYCVLFTDGAATADTMGAETQANAIKGLGTTLYVAGLCSEKATTSMSYLTDLASKNEKNESLATFKTTTLDLMDTFGDIFKDVTYAIDAKVVDYIDSRFDLVDEDGTTIIDETNYTGKTVAGGVVGYDADKKMFSLTWNNASIGYGSTVVPGWSATFVVKAKANYMGGNDIPTNGAGSQITYSKDGETETVAFSQPTVNVQVAYTVAGAEDTIFLGESLANYATSATGEIILSFKSDYANTLTEADLNMSDVTKTVTWYTDNTYTTTVTDIAAATPNADTTYYAKVTIAPKTPGSVASIAATDGKKVESQEKEATYAITVVNGSITITKKISKSAYRANEGDPIFTFRITNQTTDEVFYKTLRFDPTNTTSGQTVDEGLFSYTTYATITGLPQGIYKVEELETLGFTVDEIKTLSATNCTDKIVAKEYAQYAVGFAIKSDEADKAFSTPKTLESVRNDGHLEKNTVSVRFTNKKARENGKLTDTDTVKNSFIINTTVTEDANSTKYVDNSSTQDLLNNTTVVDGNGAPTEVQDPTVED